MGINHKSSWFLILSALISLSLLSGCKDVKDITNDTPPNTKVLQVNNQQICQSNTQNFNRLLEDDISADINCLRQSLNDFYQKVQTKNKGVIEKEELNTFLKIYSANTNGQKGIDLLYMFNYLFRGDKPDSLSKNNFNALVDILMSFNQEMIKFYPYITEIHPPRRKNRDRFLPKPTVPKISLDMHLVRRQLVIDATTRLKETFQASLNDSRNMNDRITFDDLLEKLKRQDSLVTKVMSMASFPERTEGVAQDLIKMVLAEKNDVDSAKKIQAYFALKPEKAKEIVYEINEHTDDGNEILIRQIKTLLFFKRALLGGDTTYLTFAEMKILAKKLPEIMTLIYDFINLEHIDFSSQKGMFALLSEDIKILLGNIAFDRQSKFVIVTFNELLAAADEFEIKVSDVLISKLAGTLKNLKQMVSGGEYESVSAKDLYIIVDKINYALKMASFSEEMFNNFNVTLSSPFPIGNEDLSRMEEYPVNNQEEEGFRKRFVRTVGAFRFYKGKFEIPYYGNEIIRNVEGVNQTMLYDYALGELLRYLTNFTGSADEYYLLTAGKKEVLTILDQFKDFFAANNLAPKNPDRTADNARLVTDLFQTQSNGDGKINLAEGIEFISLLSSSSTVGNKMMDKMIEMIAAQLPPPSGSVPCRGNMKDGIEVKCYRKIFFDALNSKYKKYFERLFEYANRPTTTPDKLTELLQKTEFFARDCALDSRPIHTRDMLLIMGGLLNIESTLLHFDTDQNNELNTAELNAAFPVYRSAIISAAKLKPSQEKYAHSIFFYLVKFQKLPSQIDLLKYHFFGDKNAVGDRVTIATLLKYINQMNAVVDPECI